jgi:hypothetical protein
LIRLAFETIHDLLHTLTPLRQSPNSKVVLCRPSWSWWHSSLISNYLCNQCLSPLRWGVLDTTLCDKVFQRLATGRWLSPGTLITSTNKTDRHDITEILLKVAIYHITVPLPPIKPNTDSNNHLSKWQLYNKANTTNATENQTKSFDMQTSPIAHFIGPVQIPRLFQVDHFISHSDLLRREHEIIESKRCGIWSESKYYCVNFVLLSKLKRIHRCNACFPLNIWRHHACIFFDNTTTCYTNRQKAGRKQS